MGSLGVDIVSTGISGIDFAIVFAVVSSSRVINVPIGMEACK